jgi:hypothetical protein
MAQSSQQSNRQESTSPGGMDEQPRVPVISSAWGRLSSHFCRFSVERASAMWHVARVRSHVPPLITPVPKDTALGFMST